MAPPILNKILKQTLFPVVATVTALLARLFFFQDMLGAQVPFLFFFISVAASAWYCGFTSGLIATLLGALASVYYFIPPIHSFLAVSPGDWLTVGLFVAACLVISYLFEMLHKSLSAAAYLASIMQSSDDAIVAKNLDGIITAWNRGAEQIFGYHASEAIGRHISLIVLPERIEEEHDIMERVRRGQRIDHYETVRRAKDGRIVDVSMTISPVLDRDGRLIGASNITRDITEKKRWAEKLREQQEWYQVTLSSIGDAVIATDTRANVLFMNAEAEKMTGYRAEEAMHGPLKRIFNIINEETRLPVENPIDKVIAEEKRVGLANHTVLIAKDGTEHPIADTAAPIMSSANKLLGVILVFHNVADHRLMEKQLQEKANMLAERDRRKDEFIAMLAHELRNPLAPISNALHIMQSPTIDQGIKKEAISMASRQVGHMVRLLDDLLDVSRISHGKINLQKKPVDLCEVVATAVESAAPLFSERRQKFVRHLPPCPLFVYGDATRLAQLFGNLLNNSAKYTAAGGEIRLDIFEEKEEIVIRVRDTGIGIARNKLPYIFDMFMQVDSSLERAQGGLGIGLMLVKTIATLHGGSVEVNSEGKNQGTEFIVRLPVMERPEQLSPKNDNETYLRSPDAFRMLVVDDNKDSARTLGWMLESLGHEVKLAFSAQDAIRVAPTYKPDVIFLDIGMPDMNGYEVCRIMQQDPALRNTTFIAQTGWGQEQHFVRSKEAGFDYHLIKPVSIEVLQKQLKELESSAKLDIHA